MNSKQMKEIPKIINYIKELLNSEFYTKSGRFNLIFCLLSVLFVGILVAGYTCRYVVLLITDALKSCVLKQNIITIPSEVNPEWLVIAILYIFTSCLIYVGHADKVNKN